MMDGSKEPASVASIINCVFAPAEGAIYPIMLDSPTFIAGMWTTAKRVTLKERWHVIKAVLGYRNGR